MIRKAKMAFFSTLKTMPNVNLSELIKKRLGGEKTVEVGELCINDDSFTAADFNLWMQMSQKKLGLFCYKWARLFNLLLELIITIKLKKAGQLEGDNLKKKKPFYT